MQEVCGCSISVRNSRFVFEIIHDVSRKSSLSVVPNGCQKTLQMTGRNRLLSIQSDRDPANLHEQFLVYNLNTVLIQNALNVIDDKLSSLPR